MRVFLPPEPPDTDGNLCIFLAGSIEMDRAERWQDRLIQALSDLDVNLFNPRRDDWDSSWRQHIADDNFRGQVEWELDGQERAELLVFYFSPDTRSPITLLELGLAAKGKRCIVFCPDGFWRKGNVDLVCRRYHLQQVGSWEEFIASIRKEVTR